MAFHIGPFGPVHLTFPWDMPSSPSGGSTPSSSAQPPSRTSAYGGSGEQDPSSFTNFEHAVDLVLLENGIALDRLTPDQRDALYQVLFHDPYIQSLYTEAGVGGVYNKAATYFDPSGTSKLFFRDLDNGIKAELFDPAATHSMLLLGWGLGLMKQSGVALGPKEEAALANLGPQGGNVAVFSAIARAANENNVPYNLALAVAMAESGLDTKALGDQGCSHGLFQLNSCEGEGVGMTEEQMADPYQNATRALQQFAAVAQANPDIRSDPGAWAAAAQRPADKANYATRVNGLLNSSFGANPSASVVHPFDGNWPIPHGGDHDDGDPGIDYSMPQGQAIYTPFAGTIHLEDDGKQNWGKRVMVRLANGYTFGVGHMHSFSVYEGEIVNAGVVLGESGGEVDDPSSGDSTGGHVEIQWISPAGGFLDPHVIMDPILSGTSYSGLGLSGMDSMKGGESGPSAAQRVQGIDPILESKYPSAVSEFVAAFGRHPNARELTNLVSHGTDKDSIRNYIRNQPSHIKGISMGRYDDIKQNLDSEMMNLFGHKGTDGMVKELHDSGAMSPTSIRYWMIQQDIQHKMEPNTYEQIHQLNKSYMQSIYNEDGFDPRVAHSQYNAMQQHGITHLPNPPLFPGPSQSQIEEHPIEGLTA